MEIEVITKELSVLRPVQDRIAGLGKVFSPLFEWQEENMQFLKAALAEVDQFIIENPTKENLPRIKDIEEKQKRLISIARMKEKERKDHTKNFDTIKKRMMCIEEAYDAMASKVGNTFVSLKRIENAEREKVDARDRDLNNFRTKIQQEFNRLTGLQSMYIEAKVTEVYKVALEKIMPPGLSGVTGDELVEYLNPIRWQHTEAAFKYLAPQFTQAEIEDEQKVAIYKEIFKHWDGKRFESEFNTLLNDTFFDFSEAWKNKEDSLRQRESAEASQVQIVQEEVEVNDVLATLDEKANVHSSATLFSETRDLKKSYCVAMDHSYENMIKVERAFFANRHECMAIYQGKDCWNMNCVDKAALLARLKNKDDNFNPEGIIFKEVEK